MAIRSLVTDGFGNGTFNGTVALVVTDGYTIGAAVAGPGGTGVPTVVRTILVSRADLSYMRSAQESNILTDADIHYMRMTHDGRAASVNLVHLSDFTDEFDEDFA